MSISQFDTEIEKIKYYKEKISQELVKTGIHVDNDAINKRLEAINTSLAIFQYKDVQEKTQFNVDKFNTDFECIYADLEILYKLVYKYCIDEYEKIKAYAENHLTSLEAIARKYELKTKFETGSTSLGETIFFQISGFDKDISNEVTKIDLGSVQVTPASKIVCMIDADNVDDSQVIFNIGGQTCLPYSFNHDYITVPGERKTCIYNYTVNDNIDAAVMRVMNIDSFTPSQNNTYFIFAGENMIKNSSGSSIKLIDLSNKTSISCSSPSLTNKAGKVTFYVKNGSYIKFDFAYKPNYTNFSGTYIDNLKNVEFIEIDYTNIITFNVLTDGKIYADKKNGIIKDGFLYYPDILPDVSKYTIIEYKTDKETSVNVSVSINGQNTETGPSINMIALKQLPGGDNS